MVAQRVEAHSRSLAAVLWQHAACLDPRKPRYASAAASSSPVRVHRPKLQIRPGAPPVAATVDLDAPLQMAESAEPPDGELEALPEAAREALAAARQAVREARFETALDLAEQVRRTLSRPEARAHFGRQRAELEVLTATVLVGLGRQEEARGRLRRAHAEDPWLRMDPVEHSPKVVALWAEVVAEREARR